jgi:hypothetical protein
MEDKNSNDLLQESDQDESTELEVPETRRLVYTDQGDPEIDSLYRKWKKGILIIQPDFQRGFVWDISRASRLIESILLDIPLPVIYLSQEKDGKENVIDGQQRLTSFFSFIDGKLPDPELPFGKDFRLSKLNVFTELNGLFFKDLHETIQNKIQYYKIRTITFRKESDSDLKFEVFERLNTGAMSLNDQELRNCIYRGNYNDLLWELSQDQIFRELLGIKRPERRMRDVELVLRFSAFFHATYINYKPPIKTFLNSDMEKYRSISDKDSQTLRSAFKSSISIIKSLLNENAFKRFHKGNDRQPDGYWEKKQFNASLYDILMDSFARLDKNTVYQHLDAIREAYINLMTNDQDFIDSIELSTSSTQAIHARFKKWNTAIDDILNVTHREPRCFSFQLKEQLFKSNPICAICNQRIINIDDSAVDHIEQYWTGGKTIPENARLTHKYCNFARSRGQDINVTSEIRQKERIGKRSLPRGCTVDGIHYVSGREAIDALVRKGKIKKSNLPTSSYNAHLWLSENYYGNGFTYKRDGN